MEDDEDVDTVERETISDEDDKIEKDYIAISLYYVDGPVSTVELRANVRIIGEKECLVEERKIFLTH